MQTIKEVIIGLGMAAILFLCVVGIVWLVRGKQAKIYNRLTGKNITQTEMFWCASYIRVLPDDLKK